MTLKTVTKKKFVGSLTAEIHALIVSNIVFYWIPTVDAIHSIIEYYANKIAVGEFKGNVVSISSGINTYNANVELTSILTATGDVIINIYINNNGIASEKTIKYIITDK